MVTKIKPRRIKSDNPGSLKDFLGYQDEATFKRREGGDLYTAGTGIDILNGPDYSAMRGPAPEGYHIPMNSERNTIWDILFNIFGLDRNDTTIATYLKMPNPGFRDYQNATTYDGGIGFYWSCTVYNDAWADIVRVASSSCGWNACTRALGAALRCFKDKPVIPTSLWTMLYDGSSIATGAGVFYNPSLEVISISGDGQNWYTIMDKNLGATVVYNNGDTKNQSNCGNHYQRGNNYGFPWSGTVTTSLTQVDASNYGPGNYYSSDTFIYKGGLDAYFDRSSVSNNNLWGGVTGVVTRNNEITNTGVLSVNSQTGDVIISEGNTKTFYLSGASDITTAQAAYDWYLAGKNPILNRFNQDFLFMGNQSGYMIFSLIGDIGDTYDFSAVNGGKVYLYYDSSDNVTNITYTQTPLKVLKTDYDYSTPYTPQYDGSPATKKYVDDSMFNIPVYYYHGAFSSSITFSVLTPGDYKITINGYHGGTMNKTVTITADGTDVASYQSTVIEMFSFMTVAHATSSLVISISDSSLFTIHDVYVEKIAVQSGYLTAVVN